MHPIDTTRITIAELLCKTIRRKLGNTLSRVVHAPNSIDDPDFVARADRAVLAAIAHECRHAVTRIRRSCALCESILELALQARLQVVGMQPVTRLHVSRNAADREAVFHDR